MVAAASSRQADARDVLQQFVKCLTNLKLYPLEHAHSQASIGHFGARLQRFLRRHEVLRLIVSQGTLSTEGEIVYEASDRSDNLAFRLYVDGLREVTIRAGVTAKEIERLAVALAKALSEAALDCTTLLWQADFEHVEYQALNALAEAWEQQEFLSQDSLDLLEAMNADVDRTASMLRGGSLNFELTDGAAEIEDAASDLGGAAVHAEEDGAADLGCSEEALQAFRDEVLSWGPERLLTQTIATALDGLAQEPEIVDPAAVGWLLRESVEIAIRSNDMESLADLLDRYHGELQLADEDEAEEVFEGLFAWVREEATALRFLELATQGALGGPAAFFRLCGHFGADETRLLAQAIVELRDQPDWREALFERLGGSVAEQPQVIEYLLEVDHEEVAVGALTLAGASLKGAPLEQAIRVGRVHPQPAAQEAAQQLWLTRTTQGRAATYLAGLDHPEAARRSESLLGLVEIGYRDALPRLKEIVSTPEFLKRESAERRAFLGAIRALGGTAAVAFLQEQSKRTTRLFNRQAAKELRAMAEEELGKLRKDTRAVRRPS